MEDDDKREEAMASVACLNPKFTPSSAASQARLLKFQELHKRRLKIKEKSKVKKKSKGRLYGPSKVEEKDNHAEPEKTTEDDSNSVSLDNHQEKVPAQMGSKKPQKLHWGLDTKERWERKSNM
ncbi:hypothetical protein M8C21_019749 [Ambrosia artemisiifolia]|uniref:Uncharacterized protein n=1 Tax=Ambrosia artemisiifolia TaxID=4212 RepID=A0AAD5DDU1_AMBAR|nr:hypothetical protein M8C21_019749 [Ambrosia artemisiifolia]